MPFMCICGLRCKERAQIDRMARATPLQQQVASLRSNARGGNYRISPLVSDIETWTSRLVELGVSQPQGWKLVFCRQPVTPKNF